VKRPEMPEQEEYRLSTLHALRLLDTPPDERFDAISSTAAALFGAPIAFVSLVDAERQWFKSRVGLDVAETARDVSFCGHAILGGDPMIVEDAVHDERFYDNPMVTGEPFIRFYAGTPLSAPNGQRVGALCVADHKARTLTADQRELLDHLGNWAEAEIGLIYERQALRRYLAHLLGLLAEPVVLADANGLIQFANSAVTTLLGYTPDELSGQPLITIIHESEREKITAELAALDRASSDFSSLDHGASVVRKNGAQIWVNLALSRRIAVNQRVTTMVLRQL